MGKCIVPRCKSSNRELFCAPDDKNKLRKWKQMLNIKDQDEFLVCEAHFDRKFIRSEKFLTKDAFPDILIGEQDDDDNCQCCLKKFKFDDAKIKTSEKFKKLFFELTTFEINLNSFVCSDCHFNFMNFESLLNEIKMKHELKKSTVKLETIEIDEDQIPQQSEEIVVYPDIFVQNENANIQQIQKNESLDGELVLEQPTEVLEQQKAMDKALFLSKIKLVRPVQGFLKTDANGKITVVQNKTAGQSKIQEQSSNVTQPPIVSEDKRLDLVNFINERLTRSQKIYRQTRDVNLSVIHDHGFPGTQIRQRRQTIENFTRDDNSFEDLPLKLKLKAEKPKNFGCADCDQAFHSLYFLRKHMNTCKAAKSKCAERKYKMRKIEQ